MKLKIVSERDNNKKKIFWGFEMERRTKGHKYNGCPAMNTKFNHRVRGEEKDGLVLIMKVQK